MARLETETLSSTENLKQLMDYSGKWIDQAHRHRKLTKLIPDMDSSVSEPYGHQEGTAYNGYFCAGLRPRWKRSRRRFSRENRCHRSFGWVSSTVRSVAEAPGSVHLGKIGFM
jgi:hypothetical protein